MGVLLGASKGSKGASSKPTVPLFPFVSGLPGVWTGSDLPKWPHSIGPLTGHNITLWPFLSEL